MKDLFLKGYRVLTMLLLTALTRTGSIKKSMNRTLGGVGVTIQTMDQLRGIELLVNRFSMLSVSVI
jgi:hypothetical protein